MRSRHYWISLYFLAGCVLVAAAYWVGLSGPLLLDDFGNLSDITAWMHGERSWQSVVLNNRSGVGGRPLSMASFLLDAAVWGNDIWYLKFTNLLVHLACGLVVWRLLSRLIARDTSLAAHKTWLPTFLALVWLALPINVSSVLYVVQRMAMLSALFMLVALWLFVVAREHIQRGRSVLGNFQLWVGVPALTLLGFLCKENALLVPLMAGAIELGYFRPVPLARRTLAVKSFFAATLLLPGLAAVALIALHPERILAGYALREFTFSERLLTEPRILWDYVCSILVPFGPRLGLFHDDFPKSVGFLTPWTTLPAILAWIAVALLGWRMRTRMPALLVGVLLFLAGHAMESGIIALELYFEHRNYLPAFGLLLAVAGIVAEALRLLPAPTRTFVFVSKIMLVLLPITYLVATHGRARVWSSSETLYAQELKYNPDSPRLRSFLAGRAMEAGDMRAALDHIAVAARNSSKREAMTLSLWQLLAHCAGKQSAPSELYAALRRNASGAIETYAMTAWEQLSGKIEQGECSQLDVDAIIFTGQAWLAHNTLPPAAMQSWRTRYYLARMLAYRSRFDESIAQADKAWRDSDYNNGIGVFLFQVNATQGNTQACRRVLDRLRIARGGGNLQLDRAINTFEAAMRVR